MSHKEPGKTIKFTFLPEVGLTWKVATDQTKLLKTYLIILHKSDLINIVEGIILQNVYIRITTPNIFKNKELICEHFTQP